MTQVCYCQPTSELKLQRKLNRTWSANLIERVQTTICATRSQTVRECLSRAAEQRAGQEADGIAEVWMVEDVEELSPETKTYFLGQMKLPLQSNIRLPGSKTPQHISPEVTLLSSGRSGERRAIENLSARILRAK